MKSKATMITSFVLAALMTAAAPAVFAQPPAGGPRGPHGYGRDDHGDRRDEMRGLADFLGLDDQQREAWTNAQKSHFEALRPTFQKMRDLRDQLHAELESSTPDAATVGGYVISMHQLESDLDAARSDLDTAIRGILTPEQQTKLDAWKAANDGPRHGFGPGGPGWGGPRHGHDDDRDGDRPSGSDG